MNIFFLIKLNEEKLKESIADLDDINICRETNYVNFYGREVYYYNNDYSNVETGLLSCTCSNNKERGGTITNYRYKYLLEKGKVK